MMSTDPITAHNSTEDCGNVIFSPPLYKQRYDLAACFLREAKVADFGCAECRALRIYRDVDTLQRIVGVDIDRQLLIDSSSRLKPNASDYLFCRNSTLTVELYSGSLVDNDQRLQSVEAVTLIEVVEHLQDMELSLLPKAIFGHIAPQLVVVTTPNVEFNVLFRNLSGFRHPDHKFEWTRQQFGDWCNHIASEWNYSVEFGGVGKPPNDWAHVGYCSQYAVFRRLQKTQTEEALSSSSCVYEQLFSVDYPSKRALSAEEMILHTAEYYIHFLVRGIDNDDDDADDVTDDKDYNDGNRYFVRLHKLLTFPSVNNSCKDDVSMLRRVLTDAGYQLSDDEQFVIYVSDYNTHDDEDDEDDDTVAACTVACDLSESGRDALDEDHWD